MIHFGEIVVLGCQPEYRHGLNPSLGGLIRKLDRSQCLIDRVSGTSKQSHLLASDYDRCPCAQSLDVMEALLRCAPIPVLPVQNRRSPLTSRCIVANAAGLLFEPFLKVGGPGIKIPNLRRVG